MGEFPKTVKYILLLSFLVVFATGCNLPFLPSGQNAETDLADDSFVDSSGDEELPPASGNVEQEQGEAGTITEDGTIILGDDVVSVNIEPVGRTSPFVPYKEKNLLYGAGYMYNDMPLPSILGESDDDLVQLVSAKVTGIIYDNVTPYAIINVLDNDYLVKIGDKIESFSITDIEKDYVAIKTGTNVYRAKVGDIIEGDVNESGVYNVGHRFAGTKSNVKDEDVIYIKGIKKDDTQNQNAGINDLALPEPPAIPNKTQSGNNDEVPPPPSL